MTARENHLDVDRIAAELGRLIDDGQLPVDVDDPTTQFVEYDEVLDIRSRLADVADLSKRPWILVRPGAGDEWHLVVLREADAPIPPPDNTPVDVITVAGARLSVITTWRDFALATPLSWGSEIICDDENRAAEYADAIESGSRAFRFDPAGWTRTTLNYCWGEPIWAVAVDGEPVRADLPAALEALGRAEAFEPKTIVEVSGGGASMTTGEIGTTLWRDRFGDMWVDKWGYELTYLGPYDPEIDPVEEMIHACFGDGVVGFSLIHSETLTTSELRPLLDATAAHLTDFDAGEVDVTAIDCERTTFDLQGDEVSIMDRPDTDDHEDDQ